MIGLEKVCPFDNSLRICRIKQGFVDCPCASNQMTDHQWYFSECKEVYENWWKYGESYKIYAICLRFQLQCWYGPILI